MVRVLCLFVVLAGCNAPSPAFRDVPMRQVTVQGSVFHVRIKGAEWEAIRVNAQYAPRLGPIGAKAAFAMEQVSGCTVTKVKGDAAVVHGTLDCGELASRAGPELRSGVALICYGVDSAISPATGELITDYDCDLVPE